MALNFIFILGGFRSAESVKRKIKSSWPKHACSFSCHSNQQLNCIIISISPTDIYIVHKNMNLCISRRGRSQDDGEGAPIHTVNSAASAGEGGNNSPAAVSQKSALFALKNSENYAKERRPGGLFTG